ncbi:MAG: E3 binding domain-containing protein, partial [Haliea sp.]|nr:E3 binding domain-containing protein [Haliea sp.]
MAKQQITVPDIGGAEGAEVIELLVSAGDEIKLEQGLLVLESDKASMEIPSTLSGKVLQVLVKVGDELSEGHPIIVVETAGDEAADSGASEASEAGEAAKPKESEKAGRDPAASSRDDDAATPGKEAPAAAQKPQSRTTQSRTTQSAESESREVTVLVPDIGTDEAVDVIELCFKAGDEVAEGDSLVVLESDKASMEVPATEAGRVVRWLVKEGAAVREGDPLVLLEATAQALTEGSASAGQGAGDTRSDDQDKANDRSAAATGPSSAAVAAPAKQATAAADVSSASADSDNSLAYAGPAVRKLARELGVDLAKVAGSGPRERILKEDVQGFVQRALSGKGPAAVSGAGIPAMPEVDFSAFGVIET